MTKRIFTLCFSLLLFSAVQAAPQLHNLDIRVVLRHNGDALIIERRNMTIDDEGTECYIGLGNMGPSKVKDLRVSDETSVEYENVGEWDVDKSRDWKTNRCGIVNKSNGYELCWGIGKPGTHHYKLNYTVTHCIIPSGTENVMFDMVLYQADGLQPREVVATISRADSVLTEDDIVEYSVSENNTKAIFENGRFVLSTEHAMEEDDWLGARIEFPASAFGEIDRSALNTDIAPDEMTSPMMQDKNIEKYEESWLDKFWDFYDEWPLLTLFGILGGLIGLFYVVRKVAVALA